MQHCVHMFNFLSQLCVLLCWPATARASELLHQNGRLLFNKQKTSHFPARSFFCLAFDLWCRALTGLKAECCVAIKVKLRVLELCSFPFFSLKQLVYPGFQVHSQWRSCSLLHWIVAVLLLNLQKEAFKKFFLPLPVERGIGTVDSVRRQYFMSNEKQIVRVAVLYISE